MEPHLIDDLAKKETFYWWHRVRRHNLFRFLGAGSGTRARVLEIGCGTGANLRQQRSRWTTAVGIDLEMQALAYCRDLAAVQADASALLPFADETFEAVVMLDVLEHLSEPKPLVQEMSRVLRPGGTVVIMVPAGPELWSYWDEIHGHQRRYTKATLMAVFDKEWRLEALEYSFSWMYPIVLIFRRFMERRRRPPEHSDFVELPVPLSALQVFLGRLESRMQRIISPPFGTTLCGVWIKEGAQ